jgi:hypothetical protein
LAAGKLSDLLPELWDTESAAEAWLRKNRPNPSISIIRLWVVFVDYKDTQSARAILAKLPSGITSSSSPRQDGSLAIHS